MKVENVPQLRSERKAAAEGQRDAVLLALKTEGKATSQGVLAASRSPTRQGEGLISGVCRKNTALWTR